MVLRRWEYYRIIWSERIVADEGLALETLAFESLYGGEFTLSTQLIKPNYQKMFVSLKYRANQNSAFHSQSHLKEEEGTPKRNQLILTDVIWRYFNIVLSGLQHFTIENFHLCSIFNTTKIIQQLKEATSWFPREKFNLDILSSSFVIRVNLLHT